MSHNSEAKVSLRRHKSQIGVSARAYRERHLAAFAKRAVGRKAIYLDVNYWIDLQRAANGEARRPEFATLLSMLRAGVASKALFCPPTLGLFMEISKQRDGTSRGATARLVDELSDGIGLAADDDIMGLEVAHVLKAVLARLPPEPPRGSIWTPLGCMSADIVPPPIPFVQTQQQQQRTEKAYFDTLMAATAEELLAPQADDDRQVWADLAHTLTEGPQAHADEFETFTELLNSELRGAADGSAQAIQAGGNALFRRTSLSEASFPSPKEWARVVFFTLRADEGARRAVPSLYVRAGLHALVRWNRTQKFKPNDIYDFGHASAALGYCDVFLTEGPLRDMLGRGPLKLADASDCQVVAAPDEAVSIVRSLLEIDAKAPPPL